MIKMTKRILTTTLLLSFSTNAQEFSKDSELMTTFTQDDIAELESLKNNTILKKRDKSTGLFLKDYNVYNDANRLSFLYHVNTDLSALSDLQTFEAIYAHRFNQVWIELFGFRTTGNFKDITINNPLEGEGIDEILTSQDTVTAFGASLSYRDNWIGHLFETENIFTTTTAGVGWYSFHQTYRDKIYTGPGLKADFGIHKRSTKSMHYGLKMSYQLASVKRNSDTDESPEATESSSQRAQTLSWLSFGLDLTFYF